MKKTQFILYAIVGVLLSNCSESDNDKKCCKPVKSINNKIMEKEILACSLTSVDKKERMKIIRDFKNLIIEREEIKNGLVLKFEGNNQCLDKINSLVKLERLCCSFLIFNMKIGKESQPIVIEISGPNGTKDFLKHELGL